MWWYTFAVIALWVVDPELRRLDEFYLGSHGTFVLASLPLVSLLPHVWFLTIEGRWRRLPPLLACAAWVWLGGFAYALVLSAMSGYVVAGSYDFMNFVLPAGVGLWVAADDAPFDVARRRVTRLLFALATLTSVYGIFQYVTAPAWDVAWLGKQLDSGILSYGLPHPFAIRVFSTFSAHHAFANFVAFALLLSLPELSLRRPMLLVQLPVWIVSLAATLYRTGWLVCAIGVVIYFALSPRRAALLVNAAIAGALVAGMIAWASAATGNDEMIATLNSRVATLSDLNDDTSRKDRAQMYQDGTNMVRSAPLGQGLGVIVTTKISDKSELTAFDSGLLGRAVEMGLPGLALYVLALLLLSCGPILLWNEARVLRDGPLQGLAATAIACNVAFAFEQLSFEAYGLLMLVIWLIDCLAISTLSALPNKTVRVRAGP